MKAKICQSRKSTHSIMKNSHFGELVITKHGVTVTVPECFLFSDGRLKKKGRELIDKAIMNHLRDISKEVS